MQRFNLGRPENAVKCAPAGDGLTPELRGCFEAWRVQELGGREVVDAILAPEHRNGSGALRSALHTWPGAHYRAARGGSHLVLVRPLAARRERWLLHAALFLLTLVCMLGAGAALAGQWRPEYGEGRGAGAGVLLPFLGAAWFVVDVAQGGWLRLLVGWPFAVPLLAILLVHELGHYAAARRYAIDTSPPFFLPVPPTLSPIGSLGAFLRLRSPVLDRRQLLDVGAAGPLAGFAVALVVLAWGYAHSLPIPPHHAAPAGGFVVFAGQIIPLGDSLLTRAALAHFHPGAASVHLGLTAFAGWVGVFVTGLNLLPLSQLDGGHVLYGLLGRRQAAVGMLTLGALLLLARWSWSWYLWVALALLLGGGRVTHPSVAAPERPVGAARWLTGAACVLVFAATFIPVPFRV